MEVPKTANFPVAIPIILLIDIVVIFLIIFLTLKLKNRLGVYICWIPSFISFIVMFVYLFIDKNVALYALFLFFLPYFISYMPTAIIKVTSDKRKAEKARREREELDKISIQDL